MSLFDNWDFMKENLNTAFTADGSLDKQAEIYEESWAAARNRVRASLEAVYSDLVDDKFFISLNDSIAEAVAGVDDFLDKIGGIKPLIIAIGSLILSTSKQKIGPAIQQMIQNIKISTVGVGAAYESIGKKIQAANEQAKAQVSSETEKRILDNNTQLMEVKTKLSMANKKLSADERAAAEIAISGIQAQQKEILKLTADIENQKTAAQEAVNVFKELHDDDFEATAAGGRSSSNMMSQMTSLQNLVFRENKTENPNETVINKARASYKALDQIAVGFEKQVTDIYQAYADNFIRSAEGGQINQQEIQSALQKNLDRFAPGEDIRQSFSNEAIGGAEMKAILQDLITLYPKAITSSEEFSQKLTKVNAALTAGDNDAFETELTGLVGVLEKATFSSDELAEMLKRLGAKDVAQNVKEIQKALEGLGAKEQEAAEKAAALEAAVSGFNPAHTIGRMEALGSAVSLAGSSSMALMSLKSAVDALNDSDISGIEKLTSVLMSGSMFGSSALSMGREIGMYTGKFKEVYNDKKKAGAAALNQKKAMQDLYVSAGGAAKAADVTDDMLMQGVVGNTKLYTKLTQQQRAAILQNAKMAESNAYLGATFKSLGASISSMLLPIGAVILVLGSLAAAIYAVYKETHKYREAFEDAQAVTKNATDSYDNIVSKINEVNTTISQLDDKVSALDNLEKGTTKWNEAVKEINGSIIDLKKSYGDLTEGVDYYRDSLGALHLTEKGIEQIERENQQREQKALGLKNAAQATENVAYTRAEAEKLASRYGQVSASSATPSFGLYNNVSTISRDALTEIADAIAENKVQIEGGEFTDQGFVENLVGEHQAELISSQSDLMDSLADLGSKVQENTEALLLQIQDELLSDPTFSKFLEDQPEEYRNGILKEAAEAVMRANSESSFSVGGSKYKVDENGEYITDKEGNLQLNPNYKEYRSAKDITDADREAFAADRADEYKFDASERKKKQWQKKNDAGEWEYIDPKELNMDQTVFEGLKDDAAIKGLLGDLDELRDSVKKTIEIEKGLANAKKIYKENKKALEEYSKASKEHKDTTKEQKEAFNDFATEVKKSLPKALAATEDEYKKLKKVFNDEFIADNLELIQKAIDGDVEAMQELRDVAADEMAVKIKVEKGKTTKPIQDALNELQKALPDLKVGATLDDTAITQQINNLFTALLQQTGDANMALATMKSLLALEGFEAPEFEWVKFKDGPHTDVGNGVITGVKTNEDGTTEPVEYPIQNVITTPSTEMGYLVIKPGKSGGTYQPQISNTSVGGGGNNKTTGSPSGNGGSKGSGGKKSKASKIDYTKRSDVVERYKRINDELDDTQRKYDRLNDSLDRMFGKTRVNQMNKVITTIKKENEQTAHKLKLAQNYLKIDRKSLQSALDKAQKKAGIKTKGNDFTFDSDGDIKNYYSQLDALYKKLHKTEKKLNSITDKDKNDKYKEKTVEPLQKAIENLKDKIEQYDETKELIQELKNTLRDNLNELQDLAYEKLSYKLEVKLELNDNELKLLEYYFDKLSDNVYKRSEALAKIWAKTGSSMIGENTNKLEIYKEFFDSINKAGTTELDTKSLEDKLKKISNYKGKTVQQVLGLTDEQMKKISQGDYADALQTAYDGFLEVAQEYLDKNEEMMSYYGDTLDMFQDKVDATTDSIDNLRESLDHYNSVMDLLGKNRSYLQINKVNDALVKTAKNSYDVAKATHKMYEEELAAASKALSDYQSEWEKANSGITDAAQKQIAMETDAQYEILKKNYDAVVEKAQESWNTQLDAAEVYFEALNTLAEKKLEELAWKIEEAMSPDGLGFDAMLDSLSGKDTWASLILTQVNQVYEMNKLLRQVNKDIEKTDNKAAKAKYRNFSEEIKQLREKDQLSQLELEIAQAKYKQLQAQIALEEAQNAKSTVRLSRDNEGNYGYVYTADQDKIDDAQQALDDANNDLYNIALKGATQSQRRYIEVYQEYMKAIQDANIQYKDDATALNAELARLQEKYIPILKAYASDYQVAISTDSRVIKEDVAAMFKDIMDNSDAWNEKTNDLIKESTEVMDKYREDVSKVYDDLGLGAKDYEGTINDVIGTSEDLAATATNKVIPALEAQAKSVRELTQEYAAQREELMKLLEEAEKYAQNAMDTKADLSGYDDEDQDTETPDKNVSAEVWNKSIQARIDQLRAKYEKEGSGKKVATYVDPNGYLHYKSYTGNTSKGAMADLEAKWSGASATKEATNAKRMQAIEDYKAANKDAKVWRVYDSRGYYHWSKVSKDKAIENAKEADKKAGQSKAAMDAYDYAGKVQYYDTGGYTGQWGPGAKLAGLHEKELVLNQDDTKNFLAGIRILREVVKIIDLQAATNGYASELRAAGVHPTDQSLQQNVEIKAEFPNATDRNEIEEAFNSLINRATQYANRRD